MLIYHDPNSIIREAYQKILMGGKYLLESSSSTAKALVLKKLDEEPDYIPKAYNYILKNIPDHQIATIYQQVFGRPMRGRASRNGARGKITDELGFNTTGINFLLKYAPTHVINHIGGWFDMDLRADVDSEEAQDTNTQASEKSNNYIVDEIIVKLKDLKLNNNSLYTIYRKILKSVSDKTALYTAARNLYNKKENYYDIAAVLIKSMKEQRGTFILSDFASILRYLDVEDLKKANSIVDEYIAQKKNGGGQKQDQPQTQQTQQTSQDTTQSNVNDNIDVPNIKITEDMVVEVAKQVGVKNIGPRNSFLYAKDINKIFSFAKQKGYNYALSHYLSYYKNQKQDIIANIIQKICDYIVKNPDKFNQNASNQKNIDNTPYIVDIIDISSKGKLPSIARAVGVSDDPDTIERCDLWLGALFDNVAKVGYPAARKSFMEEHWFKEGDDVIKMADYINQNKSKFMDTQQSYQKRKTALQNVYNQSIEGAKKIQAYQKSLNNSPNTNTNGMRTYTNNAPTNNIQPNQNKNQTSPTKQQSSKYRSGTFRDKNGGQTTFIVDDDV